MKLKQVQPISAKTVWPEDDTVYYEITLRFAEKEQPSETLNKLANVLALKTRPTWEVEISQSQADNHKTEAQTKG